MYSRILLMRSHPKTSSWFIVRPSPCSASDRPRDAPRLYQVNDPSHLHCFASSWRPRNVPFFFFSNVAASAGYHQVTRRVSSVRPSPQRGTSLLRAREMRPRACGIYSRKHRRTHSRATKARFYASSGRLLNENWRRVDTKAM